MNSGAYRSGCILVRAAEKRGQKTSRNLHGGRCPHLLIALSSSISGPSLRREQQRTSASAVGLSGRLRELLRQRDAPQRYPYTLQYELRVLTVTGTKAEVVTLMAIQARSEPLKIYRHVEWRTATRSEGRLLELVTNDSLYLTFDSTATVMGKTIPVTVYHYDNKGTTTILFVKRDIGLPVQFIFALDNVTSIAVRLAKTNISGLVG